MPRRLILASASPRRRELLSLLRLPFDVVPSDVPEDVPATADGQPPSHTAGSLAWDKALHVWQANRAESIVLGADTVVAVERGDLWHMLAKPKDAEEARGMLLSLSGRTHTVFTGVSLVYEAGTPSFAWSDETDRMRHITQVVDTQVTFRELTDEMIEAYIATGEPFDKAGGYGIQGYASTFVEAIYGDYFNVVGLPISTVAKMLEQIGIEWWRGPAALDT